MTINKVTKVQTFKWKEKTPLELAAMFGYQNIVEYLLGKDKNWNKKNYGMQVIFSAIFSSHRHIVNFLLQHGGIFDPNWVINNNQGDTCLEKAIRDKNEAAVNILIDSSPLIKLNAKQLDDALSTATTEKNKPRVEQDTDSVTRNGIEKSSQEKIGRIIKALERKRADISILKSIPENEEQINNLKKEKKKVLDNIKTIEEESEVEKQKYKKDELYKHREKLANIVQNLIQLKGSKEDKSPSTKFAIDTIETELRNIKSGGRDVNPKRIKQIMDLLKQTVPVKGD